MYFFKQVKLEKDAILLGRPRPEDLVQLSKQGYKMVLDIMPAALLDKELARKVRRAGMRYSHIPVEECDLEACRIDDGHVFNFSKFVTRCCHGPFIINTDDEALGLSLILLANGFLGGEPATAVINKIETLGFSLKSRKDIKRFIRDFYRHYRTQAALA